MSALPITNGFYISETLPLSHQECSNFYVAKQEAPVMNGVEAILEGIEGITQFLTTGVADQVNRGTWE